MICQIVIYLLVTYDSLLIAYITDFSGKITHLGDCFTVEKRLGYVKGSGANLQRLPHCAGRHSRLPLAGNINAEPALFFVPNHRPLPAQIMRLSAVSAAKRLARKSRGRPLCRQRRHNWRRPGHSRLSAYPLWPGQSRSHRFARPGLTR